MWSKPISTAGCQSGRGRDYELVSAIFAADGIVNDIAKTQLPVELHPLAKE